MAVCCGLDGCYNPVRGLQSLHCLAKVESAVSGAVDIRLQMPDDLPSLRLPDGVQRRLQLLLDRQDQGETLSADERREAEGLVALSELLSLLRLRAERLSP